MTQGQYTFSGHLIGGVGRGGVSGGGVSGGGVSGGLVGRCDVLLGVTRVRDISDVTVVAISLVSDGLDATIGESDVVRSRDVTVAIAKD